MGAIVKTRGAIEIADRTMLEHESCECYRIITSEYRYFTCAETHQHNLKQTPAEVFGQSATRHRDIAPAI
jgi:hypothetical protein